MAGPCAKGSGLPHRQRARHRPRDDTSAFSDSRAHGSAAKVRNVGCMRLVVVVCMVLATPSLSHADDQHAARSLKLPLAVYAGTAALDYHSTYRFLQFEDLQEWNPAINWLDHKPKTMITVGAAMEATAAYALRRWVGREHPKALRVALYAASGLHVVGAWRNYANTAGRQRIAPGDRARWERYRRCGNAC
jgi:hypothetical protein